MILHEHDEFHNKAKPQLLYASKLGYDPSTVLTRNSQVPRAVA